MMKNTPQAEPAQQGLDTGRHHRTAEWAAAWATECGAWELQGVSISSSLAYCGNSLTFIRVL